MTWSPNTFLDSLNKGTPVTVRVTFFWSISEVRTDNLGFIYNCKVREFLFGTLINFFIDMSNFVPYNEQHVYDGFEEHAHAGYILHYDEHPSPLMLFPSSHS